jgi:hypothetical protein
MIARFRCCRPDGSGVPSCGRCRAPTPGTRIGCRWNHIDLVGVEGLVGGEHRQLFALSLCDEQTIERVGVVWWQCRGSRHVTQRDLEDAGGLVAIASGTKTSAGAGRSRCPWLL